MSTLIDPSRPNPNREDQGRRQVKEVVGGRVEREDHQGATFNLGEWFWIELKDFETSVVSPCLVCLTKVGSNFYQLEEPSTRNRGARSVRVHHEEAEAKLTFEPNSRPAIARNLEHHQRRVQTLMAEVQALTARLGVAPINTLGNSSEGVGKVNKALSVLSDQTDIKAYETALLKAQKEDLPALFKQIELEQEQVARWMSAETLPLQAQANTLKDSLSEIDNRIFNVSLYAGLTERVMQVAEGEAAPMGTKLRVMQRRLYMDEECLLNYRSGGMEFNDLRQFDDWLVQPENLNRIMPFPRCIVAMKVRRERKERYNDGTVLTAFINFRLENADKSTFLYIRNGDNVYCLESEQDFGELIFPEKASYDPAEPVMVKMFVNRVEQIISRREYEDRLKATKERAEKAEQWKRENPIEKWREDKRQILLEKWDNASVDYCDRHAPFESWLEREMKGFAPIHRYEWENPYRMDSFRGAINEKDWAPFDQTNLDYDAIAETFRSKILEYNRIALIIQGLYDRSEVLHPHGPVKTWDPASFAENIDLVYDGSALLNHGEVPDIDAYIARCNSSLSSDSVTVGQDDFWSRHEADKERSRRERSWREHAREVPKHVRPYGNNGPGYLARIESWKPRAGKATFSWYRERLRDSGYGDELGDVIRTTITVPVEKLFNCSAYAPGDYKKFFYDPRTRSQYLKWAPMLLAAEEYHAGNMRPSEPVPKP